MRFTETDDETQLRRRLRTYFAELLPADDRVALRAAGESGEHFRRIVRQLGADGWLGVGWPEEYGGRGRPAAEEFIVFDEIQRAGVPFPFVTINTVGPALMRYGTQEQKAAYLPRMLTGELNVAIGYSEPEAGTDLASLTTRARLENGQWVVNGSKVFTSGANQADLVWLACRTEPEAPKHRGLSILMVPTDSPGFRWTPITTVGDIVTTATYYDDVRIPESALVGERGMGWQLITSQLNHERVSLAALGAPCWRLWDETREWAATAPAPGGGTVGDVPWVRTDLAHCYARLVVMNLFSWQMVEAVETGDLGPGDASAAKVYGTETHVLVYRLLANVLGAAGWLRPGSPRAALRGEVERFARSAQINTFGGGGNEIQREIVASAGLGMARRSR